MYQVLDDIKQLEAMGYSYQESVKTYSCSDLSPQQQALAQVTNPATPNQPATACCVGSMQNKAVGGCGATLPDVKSFIKRNAQGNQDGGVYAATKFYQQQNEALYGCPTACQTLTQDTNGNLLAPLVKTALGTCVTAISGALGCINLAPGQIPQASDIDCRGCIGRFNNVAPTRFVADFSVGIGGATGSSLENMINRVQTNAAMEVEPAGNAITAGDPLVIDDTAICHSESEFSCPGDDSQYDAMVDAGLCTEKISVKLDDMCEDGPCDSDPNSPLCQQAKDRCEVDPETGVKCMPDSPSNPCDCQSAYTGNWGDSAETVGATFASLLVLAAAL